jgi:hypothetical protein
VEEAVAFDLAAALSRNRFWASQRQKVKRGPRRLLWQGQGWGPLYAAIGAWVFREYDPPPTPERFAQLVARWQRGQEGLAVNGVRGGLWDELQPVGRAYEWDAAGESLHTWGIALDLRPAQYTPAARPRAYPDPEHDPPGYLLRHVQAHGWQWGLWFEVPHPGHLQFATGLEAC